MAGNSELVEVEHKLIRAYRGAGGTFTAQVKGVMLCAYPQYCEKDSIGFTSIRMKDKNHLHVACGDGEAKFWLRPIRIASSIRLAPSQIRDIERLIFEFQTDLLEAYNEFHG